MANFTLLYVKTILKFCNFPLRAYFAETTFHRKDLVQEYLQWAVSGAGVSLS